MRSATFLYCLTGRRESLNIIDICRVQPLLMLSASSSLTHSLKQSTSTLGTKATVYNSSEDAPLLGAEIMGQRLGGRGKGTEVRGQRLRGQRLGSRGQEAEVRGQRSGGRGQDSTARQRLTASSAPHMGGVAATMS
eukprot:CAMPEP_0173168776 /NCGR_PEP_ID=MMETSP1141-20130122/336_1 /TAXON_ID=483371 /ORGANISM="non described non described, Strain CCMP2298" /LENGTH=135 /DNA_ID=CAMNT_0014090529 /DNA_START=65 /DNA_END=473 /DNA_ORIENTATION=-